MLVVRDPIIYALPDTFKQRSVDAMSPELVAKLASEPAETVNRRAKLRHEIELLTQGKDELQRQLALHRIGKHRLYSTFVHA